jgi:hypothetical protein
MFDSVDDYPGCSGGAALAIAHPGHELRLTKWVSRARPTVHLLTSGSRHGRTSRRVQASEEVVRELGGRAGAVFGQHLDVEVYGWIMSGDARPFLDLAGELAGAFVRDGVRTVVVDGWQLYNVVHDLWHLTVRAATARAEARMGRSIELLDFAVVPDSMAARAGGPARLQISLSADELASKIGLARAFPEIGGDVNEVLEAGGPAFLEREIFSRPRPVAELLPRPNEKPLYEQYGEMRVAAGHYSTVLRWEHARPIAEALGDAAAVCEAVA